MLADEQLSTLTREAVQLSTTSRVKEQTDQLYLQ